MKRTFFVVVMCACWINPKAQEKRIQETERPSLGPELIVENLNGAITQNEIKFFKEHIAAVEPPKYAGGNVYVYGNPGKLLEACGLMYEATQDQQILDRMIYFADALLAGRNDLAPAENGGQQIAWTGKIEPMWPSSKPGITPADGGMASGSALAHLLYAAKLILGKSEIWSRHVPFGDVHHFGSSYRERALTYVREADLVAEKWLLARYVRADKKFYFPAAPNTYKPNEACPWNQMFMFTNGLVRLSACHELLNDAPDKVKTYDELVKVNINWFKQNVEPYSSPLGTPCWKFNYALVSRIEDTNHFAYESEGMWLAYTAGKYGVTLSDMTIMANTYFDVVLATVKDGRFAGNVDGSTGTGHAGGDTYVRDEYIYLADIRKDKFLTVGEIEQRSGKIAVSPQITARLLWLKNKRLKEGL